MNAPHVESLSYRLIPDESLVFDDPPQLEHETDEIRLRLAEDQLIVWPKAYFSSEAAAKEAVDAYVDTWAVHEALESRRRRKFGFEYKGAEIVDRDPPSPNNAVLRTASATLGVSWSVAEAVETRSSYPAPPVGFVLSPDAEAMWQRYEQYLRGDEPLLSMAYACLSRIEFAARNAPGKKARKKVKVLYGIDETVLRKLGELSANLGDDTEARKMHAGSQNRPPTGRERAWIEAAVRTLVRRAGQHDADPSKTLPRITMSDLPNL